MEPISTFLLGAVTSGILGNRSDAVFCEAVRLIRQRLRQAGEPVNQDLQRAVRKAYLQATYALIEARFQELGIASDILRRGIQHILHPSEEIRWLDKVRGALRDELQRLPNAVYTPPAPEFEQEIELLLRPTGDRAFERIDQFKTRLKQFLINELQKYGEPPARIKEMIQQGWQGEGGRQLDWFDLLCAFFSEELKQNQRVANIFQSQLLAQLVVEGVSIDWKDFTAQLDSFSRPILERLEQISETLKSEFADLRARFDELLPILVVSKDLRKALEELARESKGERLPLKVRQAMAFEVAWLTLLWMAEFNEDNPNPSRITAVKALLRWLNLGQALDRDVEDYFTGKEEDLMQFANQIGGWLMATDPNVVDYFQACWNMILCVAKGQVWEIPNHIQRIEIPPELRELGEDPLAWLDALHAHFESIWRNYVMEHSP